jgi:hypothetical protein
VCIIFKWYVVTNLLFCHILSFYITEEYVSCLGSVFCCHLQPKTGRLAVTGAEDDMAYVWETQSGEIVLQCKGHRVGIVFVIHSV